MEVSYKKDLRNNYLVIPKDDGDSKEDYCIAMLQANTIQGIIGPDIRIIDNRILYYYDITSKQSLEILYEKTPINFEQLRNLFFNMTEIIDLAYEYLLNENDLVLDPKYIYYNLSSKKINICYLPGYNTDIRKQLIYLIEYIMNKVEYKDNEAVLYIYNLYAICREEGFPYDKFLMQIKESRHDSPIKLEIRKKPAGGNQTDKQEALPKEKKRIRQIPVMKEKISDDQEKYYYPVKTYIYTGMCFLGAIFILTAGIKAKIIYTSAGTRIDYSKLTFLLLILLSVAGYLLRKIWDKKNRMTKVVRKVEYIDPRPYMEGYAEEFEEGAVSGNQPSQSIYAAENTGLTNNNPGKNKEDEEINPTVLLNGYLPATGCCLEPAEKGIYETIRITEFPFVIGKQKGNVDYFLDNEAVSRYHIKITKDDNNYYIMDLNSTNGTSLNSNPLSCYQRVELRDGDEVAIAGIKYIFHSI